MRRPTSLLALLAVLLLTSKGAAGVTGSGLVVLALAAAATVLSAYSGASSSEGRAPDQPVNFPHPRHAGPVVGGRAGESLSGAQPRGAGTPAGAALIARGIGKRCASSR